MSHNIHYAAFMHKRLTDEKFSDAPMGVRSPPTESAYSGLVRSMRTDRIVGKSFICGLFSLQKTPECPSLKVYILDDNLIV